jgi:DNA-binding response OmpR family regulator
MDSDKPLVLIVEDDRATRVLIRKALVRAHFQTLEADSGEAALDSYWQHKPDLLVLDIVLPAMDGFAVCRALRAAGAPVPILVLTVRKADPDKIMGLELGADDYMVKPFNPLELVARARAILRRARPAPAPDASLSCHGLRMDFRQQECFKDGKPLDLTPHEFLLLAELLRTPGVSRSREDLLARVWGEHHYGSAKGLDVYIRRLRKKIELDASAPILIRTVWGHGYCFQPEKGD